MPRLKESDEQKATRILVDNIRMAQIRAKVRTVPELAKRTRIPQSTLYGRMAEPGTFRYGELSRIARVLKTTVTQLVTEEAR